MELMITLLIASIVSGLAFIIYVLTGLRKEIADSKGRIIETFVYYGFKNKNEGYFLKKTNKKFKKEIDEFMTLYKRKSIPNEFTDDVDLFKQKYHTSERILFVLLFIIISVVGYSSYSIYLIQKIN